MVFMVLVDNVIHAIIDVLNVTMGTPILAVLVKKGIFLIVPIPAGGLVFVHLILFQVLN